MIFHEKFMQRCIELAQNGLGNVAPNPLVGSVIVHEGKIIGEGFHIKYGGPHAEVNAINSVGNKELLKHSTLYVNLEPCSHFGKTPPCADLIIAHKIPEVVIGTIDPFADVAGKGIERLKNTGCNVHVGILENECRELNKRFFTFIEKKRPYIILKWAQTSDGFIDVLPEKKKELQPTWITDEKIRVLVHKWRTEEQAILAGKNTVLKDNPKLNSRDWCGKNPLRITIDKNIEIPTNYNILDGSIPTLVFTSVTKESSANTQYITIDFLKNIIPQILDTLYGKSIQSLIVEGGLIVHRSFIDAGLWDEARILTGNKFFGNGIQAPKVNGKNVYNQRFENDTLNVILNTAE
jgi:diaminohydroxyphosphoribosylaminopyrimidine deaminase / 5-amino-6-(5-phosphoribosylamino)uracil reductase